MAANRNAVAFLLFVCGCDPSAGLGTDALIDELYLSLSTAEVAEANVLLINEQGSANVMAFRGGLGVSPHTLTFESSDPSVVSIGGVSGQTATIQGRSVGSAWITANADGLSQSKPVVIVAEERPVTSVQVRLFHAWAGTEPRYDTGGSLQFVRLSINQSIAPELQICRDSVPVTRISFSAASSNSAIAQFTSACRPARFDPGCSVFSQWGWVTGISAGEAVVTVTVRNISRSFMVAVD